MSCHRQPGVAPATDALVAAGAVHVPARFHDYRAAFDAQHGPDATLTAGQRAAHLDRERRRFGEALRQLAAAGRVAAATCAAATTAVSRLTKPRTVAALAQIAATPAQAAARQRCPSCGAWLPQDAESGAARACANPRCPPARAAAGPGPPPATLHQATRRPGAPAGAAKWGRTAIPAATLIAESATLDDAALQAAAAVVLDFGHYSGQTLGTILTTPRGQPYVRWLVEADPARLAALSGPRAAAAQPAARCVLAAALAGRSIPAGAPAPPPAPAALAQVTPAGPPSGTRPPTISAPIFGQTATYDPTTVPWPATDQPVPGVGLTTAAGAETFDVTLHPDGRSTVANRAKGTTYTVRARRCDCPAYARFGHCKHVDARNAAYARWTGAAPGAPGFGEAGAAADARLHGPFRYGPGGSAAEFALDLSGAGPDVLAALYDADPYRSGAPTFGPWQPTTTAPACSPLAARTGPRPINRPPWVGLAAAATQGGAAPAPGLPVLVGTRAAPRGGYVETEFDDGHLALAATDARTDSTRTFCRCRDAQTHGMCVHQAAALLALLDERAAHAAAQGSTPPALHPVLADLRAGLLDADPAVVADTLYRTLAYADLLGLRGPLQLGQTLHTSDPLLVGDALTRGDLDALSPRPAIRTLLAALWPGAAAAGATPEHVRLLAELGWSPTSPHPRHRRFTPAEVPPEFAAEVPPLLPSYVLTPEHATMARALGRALVTGQGMCCFYGDPGTGKSELFQQVAALLGRPYKGFDLSANSDPRQLLGAGSIQNGSFVAQEGVALRYLRAGGLAVFEEAVEADEHLFTAFHELAQSRRVTLHAPEGAVGSIHLPATAIVGFTYNPLREGRKLGPALESRIVHQEARLPSPDQQRRLLAGHLGAAWPDPTLAFAPDDPVVYEMVTLTEALRASYKQGELDRCPTPRHAATAAAAYFWETRQRGRSHAEGVAAVQESLLILTSQDEYARPEQERLLTTLVQTFSQGCRPGAPKKPKIS